MSFHPGAGEIEWLAELKTTAERVGAEVLGRPLIWRVETSLRSKKNRSDIRIEYADDATLLITGEAKRPDDPHGVTPLDTSEVDDAVGKAQHQGAAWCFTTNFHQIGLFDAGEGLTSSPLTRLVGDLIDCIPRSVATSEHWWANLPANERAILAETGLRRLFERFKLVRDGAQAQKSPDDIVVDFFSQLTAQLLEPLSKKFLTSPVRESATIQERALTANLDPKDDQHCRYLTAQGIFEILTAAMFYRVLRDHFGSLQPFLSGTTPQSSKALHRSVTQSLQDAVAATGDYLTILRLSPVGDWVLAEAPATSLGHWRSLLSFIDRLDLSELEGDVIGSIFERLIAPERRHEMGQHYTQPRLARSMAQWGVTSASTIILDPACGAGTFLVETYQCLRLLGLQHDAILDQTFGNDLDPFAVHLAAINLATRRIKHGLNHPRIRQGDAFDLRKGVTMLSVGAEERKLPAVDLVIANPPYGRSHPDEALALRRLKALYGHGLVLPETAGINFGAWFVLLGAGLIGPVGRMAFVLQSGVLQNENLALWRAWIRSKWDLVIWHTEADVWFSDARVATCVVLFSPRKKPSGASPGEVQFVRVNEAATGILSFVDDVPAPAARSVIRDLSSCEPADDLLIAGSKPDVLLHFEGCPGVTPLKNLQEAETGAGQKLGHAFYKLRDLHPGKAGAIREVEGLGTQFKINQSYLTPILSSPKDLRNGEPDLSQDWLLTLPEKLPSSETVRGYIRYAKTQGVHDKESVKARGEAWWSIEPKKWDVAVPMNAQFRHQTAWLSPEGVVNNNFNAVKFKIAAHAPLVGAALASAFGALARLYISGEVGCEGARRVLLSQFNQWPVLSPTKVNDPRIIERCSTTYAAWRKLESAELDEMSPKQLKAWRELTVAVAAAALGTKATRIQAELLADEAISEAQATVARRRAREATALGGRTGKSGGTGSTLGSRVRRWGDSTPSVEAIVLKMTIGPTVFALRDEHAIANLGLFSDDHPFSDVSQIEAVLSRALGPGFEAAWPSATKQRGELDSLVVEVESLLTACLDAVLGPRPPRTDAASRTWKELATEAARELRRYLQGRVRAIVS